MNVLVDLCVGDAVEIIDWGQCYPSHEWGRRFKNWKNGHDSPYHSEKRWGGIFGTIVEIHPDIELYAVNIDDYISLFGPTALKLINEWDR